MAHVYTAHTNHGDTSFETPHHHDDDIFSSLEHFIDTHHNMITMALQGAGLFVAGKALQIAKLTYHGKK
jgi:metal-responsive CopG/Arc/MetJ family transcriptional regulator